MSTHHLREEQSYRVDSHSIPPGPFPNADELDESTTPNAASTRTTLDTTRDQQTTTQIQTLADGNGTAFPVFRNQVAGHAPLLWHKGCICKPLNPTEYFFYSQLIQGELSALVPFTPKFYGILDMSYIPVEFQKQQQEKDQRRAEKKMVLKERERRELEAKTQSTLMQPTISDDTATVANVVVDGDTAVATVIAPAVPSAVDSSATSASSSAHTTVSRPYHVLTHQQKHHTAPAALGINMQSLSVSQSIPLSLSSAALGSDLAGSTSSVAGSSHTLSASASPPGQVSPSSHHASLQMNTWVLTCQARKKASSRAGGEDALGSEMRTASLPAGFQLSQAAAAAVNLDDINAQAHLDASHHGVDHATSISTTVSPSLGSQVSPSASSAADANASVGVDSSLPQYIVLEDLTFAYDRPCILDLKLGTRQHGINDSAKKIASKIEKCAKTTSGKLGIRLCGMQVYHPSRKANTGSSSVAPMQSIEEHESSEGGTNAPPSLPSQTQQPQQEGRFIYYDKYYGRSLNEDSLLKTLKLFFWNGEKLLLHIILLFLERLDKLRKTLELRHMAKYRFYSSSLLMVYEGSTQQTTAPSTSHTDTRNVSAPVSSSSPSVPSIHPPIPRPDHYPALSSLNSSSRLNEIVDRSISLGGASSGTGGLSRSHSIDFHHVHQPRPLGENPPITLPVAPLGRERAQSHESVPVLPSTSPNSKDLSSLSSATTATPPNTPYTGSSTQPQAHLDAEDLLELEHILARETERIAGIRRAYQPIVQQKLLEEQMEAERRTRMLEQATKVANAPTSVEARAIVRSGLTVHHSGLDVPISHLNPSVTPQPSASTPSSSAQSSSGGGSTPGSQFEPSDHISYVQVASDVRTGPGHQKQGSMQQFVAHTSPAMTSHIRHVISPDHTENDQTAISSIHASPQPPSPLPIPSVEERSHVTSPPPSHASSSHVSGASRLGTYASAPTSSLPLAPPTLGSHPKLYNRVRKTTHAQARERARLKGNIDIRLIDYAQVVKLEDGEEKGIVEADGHATDSRDSTDISRSSSAPVASSSSSGGVGDPGLLIGVNNLIYFISNIVQQEIQLMIAQERMRTEAEAIQAGGTGTVSSHTTAGPGSASGSLHRLHPSRTATPPLDDSSRASTTSTGLLSHTDDSAASLLAGAMPTAAFSSSHVPRQRQELTPAGTIITIDQTKGKRSTN